MTPYLALVLAGFALFVGVLGVVTLQGWIAELKARPARKSAMRGARAEPSSGDRMRQGAR